MSYFGYVLCMRKVLVTNTACSEPGATIFQGNLGRSEVCSESAMVVFDPWFSQAGNQHARKKPPKLPRLLAFKKPSPNHKFYRIRETNKTHIHNSSHAPT